MKWYSAEGHCILFTLGFVVGALMASENTRPVPFEHVREL
jgi:hypothetical protein